jgi:intracellular sulfur oxidation DsrE/DsrF family protein
LASGLSPGAANLSTKYREDQMMTLKQLAALCLVALLLISPAGNVWSEKSGESWEKVVFHLDEKRNARWALMLARSYLDDAPTAKIVFVAYGPGIDFLLEDAKDHRDNPYDYAVLNLMERGVEFRVCAATLSARDIGKNALLEPVKVVPSGISEIARLQLKEGYAYLKP